MRNSNLALAEPIDDSLEFGVPLPKEVHNLITIRLERLEEKLPSDAKVVLSFFHEGYKIRGCLKIRTLHQSYNSISFGKDPLTIFNNLEDEVSRQVLEWKKTRFLSKVHLDTSLLNDPSAFVGGI